MASFTIRVPPSGVVTFNTCKDPSDVIDFDMLFDQLLRADTISTATVTSDQVTIDSSSVSGNTVTFFVSGGTDGHHGIVTIKIVTANATPRTFERSFKIKVKEK